jgi:magnesium chelatase family protein
MPDLEDDERLICEASTRFRLSAHAYHRLLKLAYTLADLVGCEEILSVHLAEALQPKPMLLVRQRT